jgi:hypothetical protein
MDANSIVLDGVTDDLSSGWNIISNFNGTGDWIDLNT